MKRRYLMAAGVGMAISLTVVLASLPAVAGNGANGNGAPSGSSTTT